LESEFSDERFLPGILGMARSSDPDSANSQFFIMFQEASHLNNKYTVVGKVVEGMDVLQNIKKGDAKRNGSVSNPDYMLKVFLD
jgi:peptidylprolyl isomerase